MLLEPVKVSSPLTCREAVDAVSSGVGDFQKDEGRQSTIDPEEVRRHSLIQAFRSPSIFHVPQPLPVMVSQIDPTIFAIYIGGSLVEQGFREIWDGLQFWKKDPPPEAPAVLHPWWVWENTFSSSAELTAYFDDPESLADFSEPPWRHELGPVPETFLDRAREILGFEAFLASGNTGTVAVRDAFGMRSTIVEVGDLLRLGQESSVLQARALVKRYGYEPDDLPDLARLIEAEGLGPVAEVLPFVQGDSRNMQLYELGHAVRAYKRHGAAGIRHLQKIASDYGIEPWIMIRKCGGGEDDWPFVGKALRRIKQYGLTREEARILIVHSGEQLELYVEQPFGAGEKALIRAVRLYTGAFDEHWFGFDNFIFWSLRKGLWAEMETAARLSREAKLPLKDVLETMKIYGNYTAKVVIETASGFGLDMDQAGDLIGDYGPLRIRKAGEMAKEWHLPLERALEGVVQDPRLDPLKILSLPRISEKKEPHDLNQKVIESLAGDHRHTLAPYMKGRVTDGGQAVTYQDVITDLAKEYGLEAVELGLFIMAQDDAKAGGHVIRIGSNPFASAARLLKDYPLDVIKRTRMLVDMPGLPRAGEIDRFNGTLEILNHGGDLYEQSSFLAKTYFSSNVDWRHDIQKRGRNNYVIPAIDFYDQFWLAKALVEFGGDRVVGLLKQRRGEFADAEEVYLALKRLQSLPTTD